MASYPTPSALMTGGYIPKPKPVKKVGAFDPYSALQRQIDMITEIASKGPDLSGLDEEAHKRAISAFAPVQAQYQGLRDDLGRNKANNQQAATAFMEAMVGILQGGKTGQEGMDFAKQNYGGSYLGAIAASMGKELWQSITHDFDAQDFKLVQDLGEVMAKQPEYEQEIYNDLIKSTTDSFENRLKYLSWNVTQQIKVQGDRSQDESRRRKDLTAFIKATNSGQITPYQQAQIDNMMADNARQDAAAAEPDPNVYVDGQGRSVPKGYRYNAKGELVRISTSTPKSQLPAVRREALAAAKTLWKPAKGEVRPNYFEAVQLLFDNFGRQLVEAGVRRSTVNKMIADVLRLASNGRWQAFPSTVNPSAPNATGGAWTE
jgi:hypothetical protein